MHPSISQQRVSHRGVVAGGADPGFVAGAEAEAVEEVRPRLAAQGLRRERCLRAPDGARGPARRAWGVVGKLGEVGWSARHCLCPKFVIDTGEKVPPMRCLNTVTLL